MKTKIKLNQKIRNRSTVESPRPIYKQRRNLLKPSTELEDVSLCYETRSINLLYFVKQTNENESLVPKPKYT